MSDELTRPIKPSEVADVKRVTIPGQVFAAFNTCIANKLRGTEAVVPQDEVVAEIMRRIPCDRHDIFTRGWLDVEDYYRAEGWTVEYDKPGYNESYQASFKFSTRSKR